jgi:hypothetical protein
MTPDVVNSPGGGELDHTHLLARWFAENEAVLRSRGIAAELQHSPDDGRSKSSAWLTVEVGNRAMQIAVWDSGEAELDCVDLSSGDARSEHRDLHSDQELYDLLESVLEGATPDTNC